MLRPDSMSNFVTSLMGGCCDGQGQAVVYDPVKKIWTPENNLNEVFPNYNEEWLPSAPPLSQPSAENITPSISQPFPENVAPSKQNVAPLLSQPFPEKVAPSKQNVAPSLSQPFPEKVAPSKQNVAPSLSQPFPEKVAPSKENIAPSTVPMVGPGEFIVQLLRTADRPRVGLNVDHKDQVTLEVTAVKDGLVKDYNDTVDPKFAICPGDRIISVNGIANDNQKMVEAVMKDSNLTFIVRRE